MQGDGTRNLWFQRINEIPLKYSQTQGFNEYELLRSEANWMIPSFIYVSSVLN